ncbi:MAG: indole-3-glycerol-phosphate synthase, partial [Kiritimatiellaeota bacterium]|nr:indole-3-glycerol-phosphate synthase [Kiritimatiellota bacterium]
MNLERFKLAKAAEIARLLSQPPPPPSRGPRPRLLAPRAAGEPIRIIAEYKRASPSRGIINARLTPEEAAACYEAGGAAAVSVL